MTFQQAVKRVRELAAGRTYWVEQRTGGSDKSDLPYRATVYCVFINCREMWAFKELGEFTGHYYGNSLVDVMAKVEKGEERKGVM